MSKQITLNKTQNFNKKRQSWALEHFIQTMTLKYCNYMTSAISITKLLLVKFIIYKPTTDVMKLLDVPICLNKSWVLKVDVSS